MFTLISCQEKPEPTNMTEEEAQQTWEEYYREIKSRRITESQAIWKEMVKSGVNSDTTLALDFKLFSSEEQNAKLALEQLSESYEAQIDFDESTGYWMIKGTTRPYGINLSQEDYNNWIIFMCDIAQSHGCVFSTWNLENPKFKLNWSNEKMDNKEQ